LAPMTSGEGSSLPHSVQEVLTLCVKFGRRRERTAAPGLFCFIFDLKFWRDLKCQVGSQVRACGRHRHRKGGSSYNVNARP
jgi:hypothetical protein